MTIEFLWGPRGQPTRGPKPALSLERIIATAIEIADAEGLAAVSMQRVAADLGFTKMSLYRYLPGKAELVALMVEQAIGKPRTTSAHGWRAGLMEWAHHLLARFVRHPWALEATVGPRMLGPNELGWMELALALLMETGLTGSERLDTVALLAGHTRMIAQQGVPTQKPENRMTAMITEVLRHHSDRFPALAATAAAAASDGVRDQAFEFGLDRILDGLDMLMAQRRERRMT